MFTDKGERREFTVAGPKTVLGRNTECAIQIPLGDISRRHCELIIKKDRVGVRDLGSSNGTYVNNKRIQQAEIKAGDTLTIGPVIFTVVIDGTPDEIKPIRTILEVKKKKPTPKPAPAKENDESGTVDLEDSAELEIQEDKDSSGSGVPVELEELSKQRKGKA